MSGVELGNRHGGDDADEQSLSQDLVVRSEQNPATDSSLNGCQNAVVGCWALALLVTSSALRRDA